MLSKVFFKNIFVYIFFHFLNSSIVDFSVLIRAVQRKREREKQRDGGGGCSDSVIEKIQ